VIGIGHVCLLVTDPDRLITLYDQVLPFLGLDRIDRNMKTAVALYECRDARLAVYLTPAHDGTAAHDRYAAGLHHLSFEVASRSEVDSVFRRLSEIGAEILDPPAAYPHYRDEFYAVFFADPDDIKLEVCCRSWEPPGQVLSA